MEEKGRVNHMTVFLSMLLLIVSNARFLSNIGVQSLFEYGAYLILLIAVAVSLVLQKAPAKALWRDIKVFFLVSVLFSVGLAVQGLPVLTTLRLIATMLVISFVAIMGGNYLCTMGAVRSASYGIFAGTVVTTKIALISGTELLETAYEGWIPFGFTGGVLYKNFYAVFLLGSFMGLFFYYRYEKRSRFDLIMMAVQLVLILLSNARSTYLFLLLFLMIMFAPRLLRPVMKWRIVQKAIGFWKACKRPRKIAVICGIGVLFVLGVILANYVLVTVSATYAFRARGLGIYLNHVKGDWFHLIFGNAKLAWGDPSVDYVTALRGVLGWNTSYEIAFVNILVKNGLLGMLGFVLLFAYIGVTVWKQGDNDSRLMCFAVMAVLLLSAFVESFVSNIHGIFGVYCYLLMSGICGMSRKALPCSEPVTLPQLLMQKIKK